MHRIRFCSQTLLAVMFLIAFCGTGHSQTFTDINANLDAVFGNVGNAQTAWGDYDGDGDLDLAYTGSAIGGLRLTRLYRNDGGAFTSVNAGLPNVSLGGLAWGDYDNDGDLDLFLMGVDAQFNPFSDVYRNDGNDTFTALGLIFPVSSSTVSWADFDNDGDLDLFIAGHLLFRNDGNNFTAMNTGLTQVFGADADWGDYDNDGDLDLALTGRTNSFTNILSIFENDAGGFSDTNIPLGGLSSSSVAWGDFDFDGDLDLFVMGSPTGSTASTQIYRNNTGTVNNTPANRAA